jgi:membrane-bound lytic murein transglycosylase D
MRPGVTNPFRILGIALAMLTLAGCGGKKAPAVQPTAPPGAGVPSAGGQGSTVQGSGTTVSGAQNRNTAAPPQDAVTTLIGESERHFAAGQNELKQGHLAAARAEFDRAVGVLIESSQGAKSDPRLRAEYEQILGRISALEAQALRQGDGFSESKTEPAAIDALLAVATFPRATAKTETDVAKEIHEATYDLPVVSNDRVLSYVELFQGTLRSYLGEALARGSKYLPRIREIFQENDLPLDLAYVPLVESAFKNSALSRVKARGMWQIMLPTAGDYGLKFNWFIDERADFEKSTQAAAKHFKMLGKMFDGDWNLALASYNVGQGKILTAIKRSNTRDYWAMSESTKFLPRDTRAYVPMIWAAIIIAKNPEQFGFDVVTEARLTYDTVTVPDAVRLDTIADWAGSTVDGLRELNPELRRMTTPMGVHDLKIPAGTKAAVEAKLATADPSIFSNFVSHTVKSGETMASLARKYKTSTSELGEMNQIKRTAKLRPGQKLFVPGAITGPAARPATPVIASTGAVAKPQAANRAAPASAKTSTLTYRVKAGDTLFKIAQHFDVTIDEIKRWNNLRGSAIGVGDRLKIRRN